MRLLRFLFLYVLLSVFGAILILFLAQNWRITRVDFFGPEYSINLAWVLVGAAAFGALITFVLLLPGRLAAMVHTWSLERELRQWEQDLSQLQEQRGRLLTRHEHLLEAHERVLLIHHRLMGEHSQVIAERDQARALLAAARTSSAHQPARVPSMPRVAVVSPVSPVSPLAATAATMITADGRKRTHGIHGGRRSTPSPRWVAAWPAARPAARTSRDSPQIAAHGPVAREAGEPLPSGQQVVAMEQPLEPAPAVAHLPKAGELSVPRTLPILSTEAAVNASAVPAAAPLQSVVRALRRAAERTSVSLTPPLAMVRKWLHTASAGMVDVVAAKRVILEARLAHLKRSFLRGGLPLDSSRSTPSDAPSGDDRS